MFGRRTCRRAGKLASPTCWAHEILWTGRTWQKRLLAINSSSPKIYRVIYHDIYHYIYLYIYIIIPLWIPLVIQHNYGKIPMSKSSHRAQCRCHSWASKQVMKTNMRTDGFTAGCWCAKEHERRLSKKFTACFLVGVFADISTCVNRISIKKYRSLR